MPALLAYCQHMSTAASTAAKKLFFLNPPRMGSLGLHIGVVDFRGHCFAADGCGVPLIPRSVARSCFVSCFLSYSLYLPLVSSEVNAALCGGRKHSTGRGRRGRRRHFHCHAVAALLHCWAVCPLSSSPPLTHCCCNAWLRTLSPARRSPLPFSSFPFPPFIPYLPFHVATASRTTPLQHHGVYR